MYYVGTVRMLGLCSVVCMYECLYVYIVYINCMTVERIPKI